MPDVLSLWLVISKDMLPVQTFAHNRSSFFMEIMGLIIMDNDGGRGTDRKLR